MIRLRALVVALLAVVLVGAGCSDDSDASSPEPAAATSTTEAGGDETSTTVAPEDGAEAEGPVEVTSEDELYAVPDPIPAGEHGDLLKYEEIEASVEGATTYRVMYLSESLAGDPIVVTGTVVVPTAAAPADGRPVFTIAHGTTGIADECAPSAGGGAAELAISGPAVDRGWIVAVTDYEGLGTPGRHPYLVGRSEGRGVIDAALAAAQIPDAEASATTLIGGYSQGGHGALWANEVAGEWAPDLEVVGTFAGAPATELDVILSAASTPGVSGFGALIVAGFAAAYPEADPSAILTDDGVDALGAVDEGCVGEVFDALGGIDLVRPDGPSAEPWPELARENNPGQVVTEDPILIIHSEQDETVPVALSGILFDRMCGLGQAAERRVLPEGGGHGPAAVVAYPQALEWFDALLAGETVPNTCP